MVLLFARDPQPEDRAQLLYGLESARKEVVEAALQGLQALPVENKSQVLVALARAMRRLINQVNAAEERKLCLAVLSKYSGQSFQALETAPDSAALKAVYAPIFTRLAAVEPDVARVMEEEANQGRTWATLIKNTRWDTGNPANGELIYQQRGCVSCHSGERSIGPELTGVAQRYSVQDLFDAILFPNKDVAPNYQTEQVQTKKGDTHTGMLVFESADGILLQTGLMSTVRLDAADIAARQTTTTSIMPTGLLDGLGSRELADLYAYLRQLRPVTATADAGKTLSP